MTKPSEIDPQIRRAALHLIDAFGKDALDHVERRIASLTGGDGNTGVEHWKEVGRAVRRFSGMTEPSGA
jgi:hypothetical protein